MDLSGVMFPPFILSVLDSASLQSQVFTFYVQKFGLSSCHLMHLIISLCLAALIIVASHMARHLTVYKFIRDSLKELKQV